MATNTLTINDITSGAIDGTGSFDIMMKTVFLHLQREFSSGRITGDMYAKAYIELMNNTVAQAIQFTVSAAQTSANDELIAAQIKKINKDIEMVDAQIKFIGYQGIAEQAKYKDAVDGLAITGVIGKQKEVYTAQAKGFKDSTLQTIAKTMIDTWSVRRTTDEGTQTTPESKLQDVNIGNAIAEMYKSANIPVS